jgi:hypothetical protein
MGAVPGSSTGFSIRFTSVSPEIETLLRGLTASVAAAEEPAATRAAPPSRSA